MPLALTNSTSPRPSGGHWWPLREAAARLGLSLGQTRRKAGKLWHPQGLAETRTAPGEQVSSWWIHESADPALARVKSVEQLSAEFDLARLPADHQARILRKEQIVHRFDELRGKMASFTARQVAEAVAAEFCVSASSVYGWRSDYRAAGRAGLVDGRAAESSESRVPSSEFARQDPFFQFFDKLYLTPRRLSIVTCQAMAEQKAIESGWEIRSVKTCQRHVKRDLQPQLLVQMREGQKSFEDKCEPAIRRDYTTLSSNEQWDSDHHEMDVMVRYVDERTGEVKHGRPWITVWQDMRSRKVLGWVIRLREANTESILEAFIFAAEKHGLPGLAYVDNGKDYDSRDVQGETKKQRRRRLAGKLDVDRPRIDGAFNILNVPVKHTWTYHGQSKPVERSFRTVCDRFSRTWDTYCGNGPARHGGSEPRDLKQQLAAGKAPTLPEFTAAFEDWVKSDFNGTAKLGSGMEGQSPDAVYQANLGAIRTVPREMLIFACMPRYAGPKGEGLKVSKQGVTWRGLYFGGFDEKVQALFGQRVMLAIPPGEKASITEALVLSMDGRLVCVARNNGQVPANATREVLDAAIAEKKQLRKRLREYREARPRMHMVDDPQALLQRALARKASAEREAQATEPPPPPPSIQPHRTAFDDQIQAIRQAMQNPEARIAVGAESMSPARFQYAVEPQADAEAVETCGGFIYRGQPTEGRED